ncbi:MAG: hypothetical protein JJE49_03140 [Peptostreptococcaceae bacterium]|nr:hypothetical protein [Peptostreptococcaceae bacterium]
MTAGAIAGSNLFDHIRHMFWTVTPSLLISLIIYAVLCLGLSGDGALLGCIFGSLFQGIGLAEWPSILHYRCFQHLALKASMLFSQEVA